MPPNTDNIEVSRLAKRRAARTLRNKTEAAKRVLAHEVRRVDQSVPVSRPVRPIPQPVPARKATELDADKEFHDSLGGDP
jgi:hypothetical protein